MIPYTVERCPGGGLLLGCDERAHDELMAWIEKHQAIPSWFLRAATVDHAKRHDPDRWRPCHYYGRTYNDRLKAAAADAARTAVEIFWISRNVLIPSDLEWQTFWLPWYGETIPLIPAELDTVRHKASSFLRQAHSRAWKHAEQRELSD
jgi:hypothetical protein